MPQKLTPATLKKAVEHLKAADPVLARIIERVGPPRIPQREATFPSVARSIAFQQLNGTAANTIFGRLLKECHNCNGGASGKPPRADDWSSLTPDNLLSLTDDQMRAIGFSRAKASYLRDLAEKTKSGLLNFEQLPSMSDDEIIEHLTQVKGIGVWSAQMFLMFALKRPDVMPTLDFGINTAIKRAYNKRKMPKAKDILKVSAKWRPYRTAACWYLWRSLDTPEANVRKEKTR